MDEFLQELRSIYPKEILTKEEFDTAVKIDNKNKRKEYIKICLKSRNIYEGTKQLSIYNDAWIDC